MSVMWVVDIVVIGRYLTKNKALSQITNLVPILRVKLYELLKEEPLMAAEDTPEYNNR